MEERGEEGKSRRREERRVSLGERRARVSLGGEGGKSRRREERRVSLGGERRGG